jgi:hypothetical protein
LLQGGKQADDLRAAQEEEMKRAQLQLLRQKKKEKELRKTMAEAVNQKVLDFFRFIETKFQFFPNLLNCFFAGGD